MNAASSRYFLVLCSDSPLSTIHIAIQSTCFHTCVHRVAQASSSRLLARSARWAEGMRSGGKPAKRRPLELMMRHWRDDISQHHHPSLPSRL